MDCKKVSQNIIQGTRDYFKRNNFKKAVIGLSGGIDSSLALVLVTKALGHKNVIGLLLPNIGLSSMENYKHAKQIADYVKVHHITVPINNFIRPFSHLLWKESLFARMNVNARMRAVILYHFANSHNSLVIGTSNKTEMMLGYFTKYGDGAVDIEVIGDLWKTEVFELARYLDIPQEIITKPPTAELYHGHTDEGEIGAPYAEIDKILQQMLQGKKPKGKIAEKIGKLVESNMHKSLPIPTIKIH